MSIDHLMRHAKASWQVQDILCLCRYSGARAIIMADVHIASISKLWRCTCGAWNLEEQDACPWKGNCKKKKQIPIAEYGDGVPVQHDESAVPLKEDNDEHIEKKIKVK